MNRFIRSRLTALLPLIAVASVAVPLTAVRAGDEAGPTGDDNIAIAVNTEDGTVVFEFAFSVRKVVDGVVDQTNVAAALASCTDCTTIAVAFQAVLVTRDADIVVPLNLALAFNDQCTACFTYASATQLVFGFTGPVRITPDGRHRLHDLGRLLRELEDEVSQLTAAQLLAQIDAAERELFAIFAEEVVLLDPARPTTDATGSGGATPAPDSTTTTLLPDPDSGDPATLPTEPPTTEPPNTGSGDPTTLPTEPPDTASTVPDESVTTTVEDSVPTTLPADTAEPTDPPIEPGATTTTLSSVPDPTTEASPTTQPAEAAEPVPSTSSSMESSEPIDTSSTVSDESSESPTTAVP